MGFTDMRTSGDSDLNPRLTPGESERKIERREPGAIGGRTLPAIEMEGWLSWSPIR